MCTGSLGSKEPVCGPIQTVEAQQEEDGGGEDDGTEDQWSNKNTAVSSIIKKQESSGMGKEGVAVERA